MGLTFERTIDSCAIAVPEHDALRSAAPQGAAGLEAIVCLGNFAGLSVWLDTTSFDGSSQLRAGGWLGFRGRIDNREDLSRDLLSCAEETWSRRGEDPVTSPSSSSPSDHSSRSDCSPRRAAVPPLPAELTSSQLRELDDPQLMALVYQAWGRSGFARVLGSFALVILDAAERRVLLVRDPLGHRGLCYHLDRKMLLVAADTTSQLFSPVRGEEPDPAWLAAYFALTDPAMGATPFPGVHSLPAAHCLRLSEGRQELLRYWEAPTDLDLPVRPEELEELFLHTLQDAVRCRLRDAVQPAVLMSGGLDSAPIAGMARHALGPDATLRTYSWVFEHCAAADERQLIADAVQSFDLQSRHLLCDWELPLGNLSSWPMYPASPEQNPYRRLHERAYASAAADGCQVLLSGMCGDQLWIGAETWWSDALSRGSYRQAAQELLWHLAHRRMLRPALAAWSRPARGRLRESLARYGRAGRSAAGSQLAARRWLRPECLDLLSDVPRRRQRYQRFPRPRQAELLLGDMNGHGFTVEHHFASRHGLQMRYPMRDRRLIELALNLPTREIYTRGRSRALLRRALRGRLPETIRRRRDKATFISLFRRGVYGESLPQVRQALFSRDALWPSYIRREVIRRALDNECTGSAGVQLWLAVSLELWRRRHGALRAQTAVSLNSRANQVLA